MKTHTITFITAVLLMMAYVEIYGQIPQNPPKFDSKQEEYEYYCGQKNELTKQCQELKRQSETEKQVQNKVENSISNEIIKKKAEDGSVTAQKLLEWTEASADAVDAVENEQFDKAKVFAESLDPGEDYVIEIQDNLEVVKLQSHRSFEAYTNSFSRSIDEYNDNLEKYKTASEEFEILRNQYSTKVKAAKNEKERKKIYDELNEKYNEKSNYEKKAKEERDKAIEYGKAISRSTYDDNFKGKVDGILNILNSDVNNTIVLTENSTKVLDYEDLMERFKDCNGCGKQP